MVEQAEAILGIQKGLEDKAEGKGLPLEDVFEQIREALIRATHRSSDSE